MVTVAQQWEYDIRHIPTGIEQAGEDPDAWLRDAAEELERIGDEGWEAVLTVKRDDGGRLYHLLKRPKVKTPVSTEPAVPIRVR